MGLIVGIGLRVGGCDAAPAATAAEVILVREPNVYLALGDSLALLTGDRVTFRLKKDDLAIGTVTRAWNGELAVVRIDSGSIGKTKKLSRIQVLSEHSRPAARPMLRVGYPAAARANLLFSCEQVALQLPLPAGAYRSRSSNTRSATWTREATLPLPAPWPDTLIVRFFEDADDEEIALERGELDVAVFWPGELSRHMREQSRWQGHLYGTRSRGFVAALPPSGAASESSAIVPDTLALGRLNHDLFRDDLQRWDSRQTEPGVPVRFDVDLACPGWRELQRHLDRFAPPTARRARLAYVDRPIDSSTESITPLFLVRCPVVCAAELRPYVASLDPSALVDALDCQVRARRP